MQNNKMIYLSLKLQMYMKRFICLIEFVVHIGNNDFRVRFASNRSLPIAAAIPFAHQITPQHMFAARWTITFNRQEFTGAQESVGQTNYVSA